MSDGAHLAKIIDWADSIDKKIKEMQRDLARLESWVRDLYAQVKR